MPVRAEGRAVHVHRAVQVDVIPGDGHIATGIYLHARATTLRCLQQYLRIGNRYLVVAIRGADHRSIRRCNHHRIRIKRSPRLVSNGDEDQRGEIAGRRKMAIPWWDT